MKLKNISIVRGDEVPKSFRLLGDWTSNTVHFTIKENRSLTSVRYVDLSIGNGITATYDGTYTTFVIVIPKEDLQAVTFDSMVYDLVIDDQTPFTGGVDIQKDVRTPYDGLPVDENELQWILIDTSGFNENDMLIFDGTDLVNIGLSELQSLIYEDGGYVVAPSDVFNLENK